MSLEKAPITVTLPAVNIARAKNFYSRKLGLRSVKSKEPNSATFKTSNGTSIFLYKRSATRADHTVASFYVKNILSEVNKLKANGVKFESYRMPNLKTDKNNIATGGPIKAAWFKDTEGNILGLVNKR
ncbi:MAG: VOC family protein [Candidatus Micrarchaeota archaeon]|nr:VOC family protein [Candidatus Micrarchaeota archaeon]